MHGKLPGGHDRIVDRSEAFTADVLLRVRAAATPSAMADLGALHHGQIVIGMLDPLFDPGACQDLAEPTCPP